MPITSTVMRKLFVFVIFCGLLPLFTIGAAFPMRAATPSHPVETPVSDTLGMSEQECAECSVKKLAYRILQEKAYKFLFVCKPQEEDYFVIEEDPESAGIIRITGNNANSIATGLNYYLKHIAGVHVSWLLCEPVETPEAFRVPRKPIRKEALVKDRFFLNYCTYGYTMPWWKWPQWERFIDWMALNGINMSLAIWSFSP